ncbi:hypothetical protein NQZ68_004454 [Dissostichus eleginoides]|nr:hypothetical protein NQZ68_004454 [Dissostichus eleginoides]
MDIGGWVVLVNLKVIAVWASTLPSLPQSPRSALLSRFLPGGKQRRGGRHNEELRRASSGSLSLLAGSLMNSDLLNRPPNHFSADPERQTPVAFAANVSTHASPWAPGVVSGERAGSGMQVNQATKRLSVLMVRHNGEEGVFHDLGSAGGSRVLTALLKHCRCL